MIFVVDFGSQLAHLISRRLSDLGVEAVLVDAEEVLQRAKKENPQGIILSGGPSSVYEDGAPTVEAALFELNIPVLGICYGWQLMAHLLGGSVENTAKEYGKEQLEVLASGDFLSSLPPTSNVIMSHGDTVVKLPSGFTVVGSTKSVKFAAVVHTKKNLYGVQFHPEADHTEYGNDVLKSFAALCGVEIAVKKLDPKAIIADIKATVGTKRVVCAVSGGVDSTVAAFLIGKAIGKQLIPVYVESGLMRDEAKGLVQEIFTKYVKADLVIVEAKKRFMKALKGVDDPEEKRKVIGALYVDIFMEEAKKHTDVAFLGQGTIYSDVIESQGSKNAAKIKSHHNVGGLPDYLKLGLIEPLRHYYKDQVREIGRIVGLPEELVMQQPVPGPGYAVRIRGEVTENRLEQVKKADRIVIEEIKRADLWGSVFQCFAVMTGAYSTAVKGDGRVFAEVVGVRAYESNDIMTSRWAHIPFEVLEQISSRIVNEVPDVSRVVYDITNKPPATMEWE